MPTASNCLDCATPLAGRWCHTCGQDSRDPLRAISVLFEEFIESTLAWDSRLTRTLRTLLTRPGALTDAFVAGQRARYLGPVRLYILASVVYAAMFVGLGGELTLLFLVGGGDVMAGQREVAQVERWLSLLLLLLMPIAAVLMALAFRRRGIGFVEHLVFTLHFNSFVLLAWAVGGVFGWAADRAASPIAEIAVAVMVNVVVAIYGYRAACRHYRRSVIDGFLRFCSYGVASVAMLRGVAYLGELAVR